MLLLVIKHADRDGGAAFCLSREQLGLLASLNASVEVIFKPDPGWLRSLIDELACDIGNCFRRWNDRLRTVVLRKPSRFPPRHPRKEGE